MGESGKRDLNEKVAHFLAVADIRPEDISEYEELRPLERLTIPYMAAIHNL